MKVMLGDHCVHNRCSSSSRSLLSGLSRTSWYDWSGGSQGSGSGRWRVSRGWALPCNVTWLVAGVADLWCPRRSGSASTRTSGTSSSAGYSTRLGQVWSATVEATLVGHGSLGALPSQVWSAASEAAGGASTGTRDRCTGSSSSVTDRAAWSWTSTSARWAIGSDVTDARADVALLVVIGLWRLACASLVAALSTLEADACGRRAGVCQAGGAIGAVHSTKSQTQLIHLAGLSNH